MRLLILCAMAMLLSSCVFDATSPYGSISSETDSQIFTYTDADVKLSKDGTMKSDDTTIIIVGVKDNTGADLDSIFNHAMTQIKNIFKARGQVYSDWINAGKEPKAEE